MSDLSPAKKRALMKRFGGKPGALNNKVSLLAPVAHALEVTQKAVSMVYWGTSPSARIEAALVERINRIQNGEITAKRRRATAARKREAA